MKEALTEGVLRLFLEKAKHLVFGVYSQLYISVKGALITFALDFFLSCLLTFLKFYNIMILAVINMTSILIVSNSQYF